MLLDLWCLQQPCPKLIQYNTKMKTALCKAWLHVCACTAHLHGVHGTLLLIQ